MTDDAMVRWHHQLKGYEFEQAPGDGEGQGILVCLSPWCHKESDTMSSDRTTTSSVPLYHSISVFHLETILFLLTKYERMVGMSSGIQVLKVITTQKAACERFDKVHNKVDRLSSIYEIKLIR